MSTHAHANRGTSDARQYLLGEIGDQREVERATETTLLARSVDPRQVRELAVDRGADELGTGLTETLGSSVELEDLGRAHERKVCGTAITHAVSIPRPYTWLLPASCTRTQPSATIERPRRTERVEEQHDVLAGVVLQRDLLELGTDQRRGRKVRSLVSNTSSHSGLREGGRSVAHAHEQQQRGR